MITHSLALRLFPRCSILFFAAHNVVTHEEIPGENLCIYCLSTEGSFTSEEHVVPESLGNDDAVLPKGFVCDACNNGVLSGLDSALIHFDPIAFLRVQHVPYTKAGKFPKANFSTFTFEKTGPRHLKLTPKSKAGEIKNLRQIGEDTHAFNVEWKGKKLN